MYKKLTILLLLVFIASCSNNYENEELDNSTEKSVQTKEYNYDQDYKFNESQLNEDLKEFEDIYKEINSISDINLDFEGLSYFKDEIKAGMTEKDFYRILDKLVYKSDISEFLIAPSEEREFSILNKKKLFPLDIIIYDNKIYSNSNYKEIKIGDEITKINSINSIDMIKELKSNYDGRNQNFIEDILSGEFSLVYFDNYGYFDEFNLTIKNENGIKDLVILSENIKRENLTLLSKISYLKPDQVFIEKGEKSGKNYYYLYMPTINDENKNDFLILLDSLIKEINKDKPKALILDISGNRTEDPKITREVFSRFINNDFVYYKYGDDTELLSKLSPNDLNTDIRLILISDRNQSSIVNQFLYNCKLRSCEIYGMATSGGSSGFYDFKEISLKNTGIRLRFPTKRVDIDEFDDYKNGIYPDEIKEEILFKDKKNKLIKIIADKICST